jgi:allophanate hydrolase
MDTSETFDTALERFIAHADVAPSAIWISRLKSASQQARNVSSSPNAPLANRLLAVKDNIDVAGFATTAACPAFSYTPLASASVVQRLTDAGATVVGKTNLDQFACGLVGTRSPYGEVPNSFNQDFVWSTLRLALTRLARAASRRRSTIWLASNLHAVC